MITLHDLAGKNVLLLGYGKEGAATEAVLKRLIPSAHLVIYDDHLPDFSHLPEVDPSWVVIKTPGVPVHHPVAQKLRASSIPMTTATNLFFAERKGKGKIIGITATKGKSTTASLMAGVLKEAGVPSMLVGNIGLPMLSMIDAPNDTMFVVELSSYMLADLEIGPDIAVFVNLFEEHMDWHGSVEAYQRDKMRIATTQTEDEVFVYNENSAILKEFAGKVRSRPRAFALHDEPALEALTLEGAHNKENACAVLAVCDELGIGHDIAAQAFTVFKPLPHRLERVGTYGGITFINDSISTTPQSALAAIDVHQDALGAIILGGQDRGYDFTPLAERLAQMSKVRVYVLPGGEHLEAKFKKFDREFFTMPTFDEIVNDIFAHAKTPLTCLLSPASPSYGQFKNFEDRGEQFKAAILRAAAALGYNA